MLSVIRMIGNLALFLTPMKSTIFVKTTFTVKIKTIEARLKVAPLLVP